MSAKEKDVIFWDALAHEFASDVLDDEDRLREALGYDEKARSKLRDAVRVGALREIARTRRARLRGESGRRTPIARIRDQFSDMPREELIVYFRAHFGSGENQVTVHHRKLESITTEDLRTMLEDAESVERDEDDG